MDLDFFSVSPHDVTRSYQDGSPHIVEAMTRHHYLPNRVRGRAEKGTPTVERTSITETRLLTSQDEQLTRSDTFAVVPNTSQGI